MKLNELKIKELKKQVPNTRLRPLRGKRRTVDDGRHVDEVRRYDSSYAAVSQKPRYDPMDHSTVSSKKRLNPLHSSLPISQTPNNKNTVMRRKYEQIPKGTIPRDKSQ